jgi:hypothetical protein
MEEELIIEEDEILTVEKPDEDLDTTSEKEFTPKKPCPFCGRMDCEWIE